MFPGGLFFPFKKLIMNKFSFLFLFSILFFLASCNSDDALSSGDLTSTERNLSDMNNLAFGLSAGSSSSSGSGSGQNNQAGLITAGEWNDLDNWDFWNDILEEDEFSVMPSYWFFFTKNRISVLVEDIYSFPVKNVEVHLIKGGNVIWKTKTDNFGRAELWTNLFYDGVVTNINSYQLIVDNSTIVTDVKLFQNGINKIEMLVNPKTLFSAQLAFVVDATGSMGDEIEFLKSDLKDVINRVESNNPDYSISTGSVFYRDEGDEYLTKFSPFSDGVSTTLDFIEQQSAGGGGDYPEAVHSALNSALNDLNWSSEAMTRIIFLLLDAPPHYEQQIISDLYNSIEEASERGIKIIPVSASGVDKKTEFLMRFFAVSTNGTYVFITNDSGIGNEHIEATVGEFKVEYLNDLMVRLINKYME